MATSVSTSSYPMQTGPVVVCVGDSPAEKMIREAAALARGSAVPLQVLHISRPGYARVTGEQLSENLALAEHLGAQVVTQSHANIAQGIITYIKTHPISTLFIGRSSVKFWRHWLMSDIPSQVLLHAGNVDIQIVEPQIQSRSQRLYHRLIEYLLGTVAVSACTGLLYLITPYIAEADIIMAYLALVVVLAYAFDRGPTLFAAILSVAMFDFFFVTPYFTFAVDHEKYLISFAVMAAIGFMFSSFSEKLKQQLRDTSAREHHLRDLYQLARSLAAASSNEEIYPITQSHLAALSDTKVGFFQDNGDSVEALSQQQDIQMTDINMEDIKLSARDYCELMEKTDGDWELEYFPMGLKDRPLVTVARISKAITSEQRSLLNTGLSLVNLAITRTQLSNQATEAKLHAESEQLRNAILSAVSHDLRTPLSTIMGLVSTLLDREVHLDKVTTTELLETIYNLSEQLSQKVTNLLQMSRTLRGKLQTRLELQNPEELIGGVLSTMRHRLENHLVQTDLDDTLLVAMDLSLMEVVLANLLDNAVKFSPAKSTIYISGKRQDSFYVFSVRDQGVGLDRVDKAQLFEQFYRTGKHNAGGTGLGLAISKAIVEAHGGHITATNAPGNGAIFTVQLPVDSTLQELDGHDS